MKKNKQYYQVQDDFARCPDAWLYVAYSARGAGKTYSFLRYCILNEKIFLYLKRTQIDIDLITRPEFSPFKPLMRDYHWKMETEKLYDGISAVYRIAGEERILCGYCLAMSAVHKYKGFDLSEVEYMCLDEFIPQLTERVNRQEGNLLLDLYMTVSRDREAREQPPLKLCLFANATELYCPITETLQIVDDLSEMNAKEQEYKYIEDRKIFLHRIPFSEGANTDSAIFRGMQGTQWAEMAFGGQFSFNDFSKIKKIPLKGFVPYVKVRYNRKDYYIYQHKDNGMYYMCQNPAKCTYEYDMEIESDQSAFYDIWGADLQQEIIDGNMMFSSYSSYNFVRNFRRIYKNI